MLHFLVGTTLLKSVTPYFRKHVLGTLTSDEFLLLNSCIVFFIIFIIFVIKILLGKQHETLNEIINDYKKLSYSQVLCISLISIFTVLTSLFIYELDKKHNTPLINTILLRFGSVIVLILVGIFVFGEDYNWIQVSGIFLAVLGVFLIMQKNKERKQ
uniref:EamA domain-containing protein n=1 Tax=viral metagenome TaxID=1070528 RepID=A0A6C0KVQ6_9ZZZZ